MKLKPIKSKYKTFLETEQVTRIDRLLSKTKGSLALHPNASPSERFKHSLCRRILGVMIDRKLTQRELAKILKVHESRISEILHYRVKRVSIDRLTEYLSQLEPKVEFKVA